MTTMLLLLVVEAPKDAAVVVGGGAAAAAAVVVEDGKARIMAQDVSAATAVAQAASLVFVFWLLLFLEPLHTVVGVVGERGTTDAADAVERLLLMLRIAFMFACLVAIRSVVAVVVTNVLLR